jgi:hypothetical protein
MTLSITLMCECTNFLARLTFMIVASFGRVSIFLFVRIVTSGYDKKKNLRKTWFFVHFLIIFFTRVQVVIFRKRKLINFHKFDNNWL